MPFHSSIKNSIKKMQDESRKKKADKYGVSLGDYDKAVSEAKTKGKKVAYGNFLKDVEKQEYLVNPKRGDSSGKSTIDQILDSFAGTQTKPKRKKTTKRKTPSKAGKYTVIGGIAYPLATNKSKKRRKQKSKSRKPKDDWLGDLGINF